MFERRELDPSVFRGRRREVIIHDMTAISDVKRAVHMKHGKSRLLQSVPVKETFRGAIVWQGTVHIFDVLNGPRLYVWSAPALRSDVPNFWMIPHGAEIDSPAAAVHSVIFAGHLSD
jgi:hypothetical protein